MTRKRLRLGKKNYSDPDSPSRDIHIFTSCMRDEVLLQRVYGIIVSFQRDTTKKYTNQFK